MSRKRDTPCVLCGVLMWSSTTSRPAAARVCKDCRHKHPLHTVALPPEGVRANRADQTAAHANGSCAICGRGMFRAKDRPAGTVQVCHPCRRATPSSHPSAQLTRHAEVDHVCIVCSAPFVSRSKTSKYCTTSCRVAARSGATPRKKPTDAARRRYYERHRPSTTERGMGADWQRARRQVIAEETHCGFCHQAVDKALPAQHPLSATVDHIVSRREGGGHARDNLRLAHFKCNAAGGGRMRGPARTEKQCEICGGPFWASYNRQRTCGVTCGAVLKRRNRP